MRPYEGVGDPVAIRVSRRDEMRASLYECLVGGVDSD